MTVFERMMYATVSITIACAVGIANYIYVPTESRLPSNTKTQKFISDTDQYNERVLRTLFPYEDKEYPLSVPLNMSYTTADFQKFQGTYLEKREAVSSDYLNCIAFCGDSITYHLGLPGRALADKTVIAYGGLAVTTYANYTANPVYNQSDDIKTPIQWLSQLKPEIIYLNLGTNGIAIYPNDDHLRYYEKLLDKIAEASPTSIIVLVAAPPWGTQSQSITKTEIPVLNIKIDHYNMMLLELAKKRGYYFLNAAEVMKDAAGNLDRTYAASDIDGIHWSVAGRDLYIKYILEHPIPGY